MMQPLWKVVYGSTKIKIELPYDPAIPLVDMYPKYLKAGTQKYLDTYVCCSITHNSQKMEATHVSTDRWSEKQMWYIHIMRYYSALQINEVLTYGTTQRNPEDITLSEISQTRKNKYCMIPLI